MYDWKSQFALQRHDYVKRTGERLAAMESMLTNIAENPADLIPLKELGNHFHQLVGSSAIYDMEQLGETAGRGEKLCNEVLTSQQGITRDAWSTLKELVHVMQNLLAQSPQAQEKHNPALDADIQRLSSDHWTTVPSESLTLTEQTTSGGWALGNIAAIPARGVKAKDVLVVDGDQANLLTLTRALEMAGMQVRGFRTTESAKNAIRDRLPDALIVSIPLIDGPGYDVAYELRTLPDGHVPPILILSRQIGFLDKVTAIRCGADAFFNEISDPSILVKKLQSLLERDKPGNYTILSVEDDPDQSAVIRSILESVGYNVHSIGDPRQFEEALLATNPDLLLLDVMLGPMSGFELARYVRADDRYAATPIIFLTTQNQLDAHVESARVGGDEHLIKPIAPQLLIAAVSGRLERYRILKNLIGRDGLTQFLTLSAFMDAAEKLAAKRFQTSGSLVMLMIDVDDLEMINERFGYIMGDRIMFNLAKLLKAKLRNAEIFGRLGADDFAVIMENVDDQELAEAATQVIREFEAMQYEVNGQRFNATISAGAAALEADMNLKTWMNNTAIALRSAKANGKNRVMKAKAKSGRV